MTRILTVDDSRAVRTIVSKGLAHLPYDILEAEDGEKGLAVLEGESVDLILLDVTMPVMDGPTMLEQLRSRGDRTPVILLTAESKTSTIGGMLQKGVSDYILKPFKADQLCAKIEKVLGSHQAEAAACMMESSSAAPAAIPAGGKPFSDILLVDDMDNVAKKMRSLIPAHLRMKNSLDGQSAVAACKERVFRTVIIDTEIPDVNTSALLSQLRVLQPSSAFLALFMRNADKKAEIAKAQGFDGYLVKPFDPVQLDDFLAKYYQANEMLSLEDNVGTLSDFAGRAERVDRGYPRLLKLIEEGVAKAAAACFDTFILDMSRVPDSSKLPKIATTARDLATDMGLEIRIVTSPELREIFAKYEDTKDIPVHDSVPDAKSA